MYTNICILVHTHAYACVMYTNHSSMKCLWWVTYPLPSGELSTDLWYFEVGLGCHNLTIVATAGQLRIKNELSFECKLHSSCIPILPPLPLLFNPLICSSFCFSSKPLSSLLFNHFPLVFSCADSVRASCFGTINLGSNTYFVTCSSDNGDLEFTECVLDGQVVPCMYIQSIYLTWRTMSLCLQYTCVQPFFLCTGPDLNVDISSLLPGQHTLQITGSNEFGYNTTTTTNFHIRKSKNHSMLPRSMHVQSH